MGVVVATMTVLAVKIGIKLGSSPCNTWYNSGT